MLITNNFEGGVTLNEILPTCWAFCALLSSRNEGDGHTDKTVVVGVVGEDREHLRVHQRFTLSAE